MASNSSDDARLAQQMQQAEMGYAPRVVQGTVVQGTVVQGVPAHAQPTAIGVPAAPLRVAVVPDLPAEEIIVLSLRYSVICLAVIDAITTALPALSALISGLGQDTLVSVALFGHQVEMDLWVLGLLQLAFLAGPLCGLAGARAMKRGLVSVYLGFCIANTFYKIAFAFISLWLWFVLVALIQVWVTRIVYRFWSALGLISASRAEEMRRPDFIEKAPATMIYW